MAKPSPDFDAGALCAEVFKQDLGLQITTNDPEKFKRRMYAHMSKNPQDKLAIHAGRTPTTFLLIKQQALPNGN